LPKKYKGWNLSKRFVPGEGPANSKIMIVGQAPGDTEDKYGRPFIGISGKLLEHLLNLAKIKRSSVYITSVVQFYPPRNRAPNREEIAACRAFLNRQIAIIKPRLVVLLGNVAAAELLGVGKVLKLHGSLIKKRGVYYFVTLHPSAAVRIKRNLPTIESDFRRLKGIVEKVLGQRP
ncbi:MAG: uracil-DNA glycosylase, partial [Candidatus Micrarchaeaceae archaeon]